MSQVHASAPAKASQPVKAGRKAKGPRPKHVPQRTCIACRETGAKRGLIRLVRTPAGTVEVDPTGKRNGRGAYLCARMSCWLRGINEKTLSRALRLEELTEDNRAALLRYADERVPEDEPAATTTAATPAGTD